MRGCVVLLVAIAAVAADSSQSAGRIVGGSLTTIDQYPYGTSLLSTFDFVNYWQSCGGSIINNRAVLSAAHCFVGASPIQWRIRVGSTFANSGGTVHNTAQIINHPNYNTMTTDNDIAVLHSATFFVFINNFVQPGAIAGTNYNLPDNQVVWAIGWGRLYDGGPVSEQLRHVQIWTINQATCRNRYAEVGQPITDSMLCSGWLDVGGRDQCSQDSGGPLLHNDVIVGVCSFGVSCAHPRYPGVNARVSSFTNWIVANA